MTATRIELSVIIPCYNAGAWVAETIRSVLAQSTPPLEIIAVNDGSTDATAEILSGFDGRVRVITQTNLGLGAARNAGARVARGEWLGFLDADDLYLPDALTRYVSDRAPPRTWPMPARLRRNPATRAFSSSRP